MEKLFSEVQAQQSQVDPCAFCKSCHLTNSSRNTHTSHCTGCTHHSLLDTQTSVAHQSHGKCLLAATQQPLHACCALLDLQGKHDRDSKNCHACDRLLQSDLHLLLSAVNLQVLSVSRPRSVSHRSSARRATEPDMSLAMQTATAQCGRAAVPTQHSRLSTVQPATDPANAESSTATDAVLTKAVTVPQIAVKVQRSLTWTEGDSIDSGQSGETCCQARCLH